MNKILVYHPTGNQNVRNLLIGLSGRNILHSFHTTIAVFKLSLIYPLLSWKVFHKIARRTFPDCIRSKTVQYPFLECLLFLGKKTYKGDPLNGSLVNKVLANDVALYLKKHNTEIDAVYGFPFGSIQLFKVAKQYGIKCIYELTTGYYKSVKDMAEVEKRTNPELASTIKLYTESQNELNILDEELSMSDCILCASTYIGKTLHDYGYHNLRIIKYGFPQVNEKTKYYDGKRKLKVMYAGNISQLKGVSYLFDAVDAFDNVNLTLVGTISDRTNRFLTNKISKYNYLGTLNNDDLLKVMHLHDVFIFPTLSDGFGMVISEAMSQGTPVITTVNSGGPDIIENGINGWIVPLRDSESIKAILADIQQTPSKLELISKNAIKTAQKRPWLEYSKEVSKYLCNFK